MEAERLPRGANPAKHTKLGPGGIADVEWTVQLLQLQHAHRLPALRSSQTIVALRAARDAGIIDPMDAGHLEAAWTLASRIRNQIMLMRGRGSDSLPSDNRELASLAELLGYGPGESSHLLADYRRVTRRARAVVERVFWGSSLLTAATRSLSASPRPRRPPAPGYLVGHIEARSDRSAWPVPRFWAARAACRPSVPLRRS